MTKKIKIAIIVTVCLIIVAGGCVWLFAQTDRQPLAVAPDAGDTAKTESESLVDVKKLRYSEPELREMVEKIAREQFGDDAFLIFLSSEGPTNLEIAGVDRNVYIYAADSRGEYTETGKIRSVYHVDADTGEVFDNGNGKMEKIKTGE